MKRNIKAVFTALAICGGAMAGLAQETPFDHDGSDNLGNPGIKPPFVPTEPYGHTYGEWAAKYWQWALAFPANADPASDTAPQETAQSGPVWFLAGIHGSIPGGTSNTVTRQITVPKDKALFFAVLSVFDDNTGCPNYNNPLLTASQLKAQLEGFWDSAATETTCTIDGVAVNDLGNPTNSPYLIHAPPFGYTVAATSNLLAAAFGEPCIPDGTTVNPAVAEGIFLMVQPLSPGQHTINFVGAAGPLASPFLFLDITYDITVTREHRDRGDQQ